MASRSSCALAILLLVLGTDAAQSQQVVAPNLRLSVRATQLTRWLQYANAACDQAKDRLLAASVTWSGICRDGRLDGPGELTVRLESDAISFTGAFSQGLAQGTARVLFERRQIASFTGELRNGLPNGHGIYVGSDGMRVEGDFLYDALGGSGIVDYADGSRFTLGSDVVDRQWFRFADGTTIGAATRAAATRTLITFADGSRLETDMGYGVDKASARYCTASGRRIDGTFEPMQFDHGAPPAYPPLSRRLLEEGTTELSLRIEADGTPSHLAVHQSSGAERLDNAALAAAAGWHYRPARIAGGAIAMDVLVAVPFDLNPAQGNDVPVTFLRGNGADRRPWRLKTCAR